ncbi:MAG: hypothetical protein V4616_08235 [Bacteroidota bacterium]
MKTSILILSLLLLVSCSIIKGRSSGFSKLNQEVDRQSRASVSTSPFKSAGATFPNLDRQKKVRQVYLDEIARMRKENPSDTLILTEFFTFNCPGCEATYADIQKPGTIRLFDKKTSGGYVFNKEITEAGKPSEYSSFSFQVKEIFRRMRSGKTWNADPAFYGNEKCKDGAHTFYTIFFPDGKVESMYVRCWTLRPGGKGHW